VFLILSCGPAFYLAIILLASGAAPIVRPERGGNALQSRSVSRCRSDTNDNSVAILPTYATARVLLSGDAEAREEYMARDTYTRRWTVIKVPKLHTLWAKVLLPAD
jgi:hypothetical protein